MTRTRTSWRGKEKEVEKQRKRGERVRDEENCERRTASVIEIERYGDGKEKRDRNAHGDWQVYML